MDLHTVTVCKKDIETFLVEMNSILCSPDFDIDRDFMFTDIRANDDPDDEFTNANTMLELGFDRYDVVEHLKTLTVEEYTESMLDTVAKDMSFFHVFGRKIQGRDVYIKIRIKLRKIGTKYVFCVSFHFARHSITHFPHK